MTRARLYVLIDAFERDMRTSIARFILAELTEEVALGKFYEKTSSRKGEDEASSDATPLAEYLDLREAYDLLNTHRTLLPEELAREVRELTPSMDRLVGVRRRVMHPRPLVAGDSDAAAMILNQFQTRFWPELQRMFVHLDDDPSWEPLVTLTETDTLTLHNLPLPEYDETGLVGRAVEVDDLLKMIKRGREAVITITGEGGIGKTAVALEVAYRLVDDQTQPFDAVLWTSLKHDRLSASGILEIAGAARDLTGAIRPLGQTLDSGFHGTLRELADALQELKVLVVFDNLETIGGLDFKQLYETLPDSVFYLVTSRIGVGEYERRYELAPLSEKDSVRLFNDYVRARRLTTLMKLTNDTRLEVVRQLRHSPLAIRWFVLAVESGKDALSQLRNQDELLDFCVRSVYDSLSDGAREVLAALSVLSRSVAADELVVLLEKSTDELNVGLQELIRGSLVRRDASGVPGDMAIRVRLTETATQFLTKRVAVDRDLAALVLSRDQQYRVNEEQRLAETAIRSLAPMVVRTSGPHDVPTAQILRKALLCSRGGDYGGAFSNIETAHRLNPALWEVDRVEAFIRASMGDHIAASASYKLAYQKADTEGKAVVAHFYAGHLARHMKDLKSAIEFETEANAVLDSAETAVALGNFLVWNREFEAGIRLIEPASNSLDGKARLIALSSLSEAYRRWAESARDEEHNTLLQFRRAKQGLSIALASLETGVSDRKLRDIATDCAAVALNAATSAAADSTQIQDLPAWVDELGRSLIRMVGTPTWPRLLAAADRFAKTNGAPAASLRLRHRINEMQEDSTPGQPPNPDTRLVGEIVSKVSNYGFIRHSAFPSNLFFHGNDVGQGVVFADLHSGALVSFLMQDGVRGPRAIDVMPQS